MIDKKQFWNTLREVSSDELEKLADVNLDIAKSELVIEKLLNADEINKDKLMEECYYVSAQRSSMAYVQGLQDGTKLLHLLLSGDATSHMLKMFGELADNKSECNGYKLTRGGSI